jgi:hypothetical protein
MQEVRLYPNSPIVRQQRIPQNFSFWDVTHDNEVLSNIKLCDKDSIHFDIFATRGDVTVIFF